jgi:glucokinase
MTPRSITKRCGLDIGGTQIKSVILDEAFGIIDEMEVPSNAYLGPDAVKDSILKVLDILLGRGHSPISIGIGCAGSVDSKQGIVRNSPNFAHWKSVDLKGWLEQKTHIPVKVDNDANCATLAEWKLGKGKGASHLVLLTLGTGIGGGLVLDNRLYRGATGTGGELGHFSIQTNGIQCACGNRGCFERYCSASALKMKLPNYTAKEIFELAESNNECKQLVLEFLHHLKVGLTSLANIFDPDILLLGGAISKGLSPYLGEIRTWVKENAFPAIGAHLQIELTQFENNSGALGAALLHTEK